MVEDPLQLLRIKCVADEQGDGVLGELLVSQIMTSLIGINTLRRQYSEYNIIAQESWILKTGWIRALGRSTVVCYYLVVFFKKEQERFAKVNRNNQARTIENYNEAWLTTQ